MDRQQKEKDLAALKIWQQHMYEQPVLRNLFFELTDSCNLHCQHCGSNCGAIGRFLDYSQIEKILYEVADRYDPKEIWICITGGEPVLYPDLVKIVALSRKLGFYCGMTTNATPIDADLAVRLAAAGLQTVGVSLDGLEQLHNQFRGDATAFQNALTGCRHMMAAGIPVVEPVTVAYPENLNSLPELYDFILNFGFKSWKLTNVDPIGRAKQNDKLLLNANQFDQMLDFIRQVRNENRIRVSYGCAHYLGLDDEKEVRRVYFQCGSGVFIAGVTCSGDYIGCLDVPRRPEFVQGNAATDDFCDVWENQYQIYRRDRSDGNPVCEKCEHHLYCMGDAMHTWDFDADRPGYCIHTMQSKAGREKIRDNFKDIRVVYGPPKNFRPAPFKME